MRASRRRPPPAAPVARPLLTPCPTLSPSRSELATTPLLVIANKVDLQPHLAETEIIKGLNLDYVVDNPWIVIPCSALRNTNVDQVVEWLVARGR